MGLEGHDSRSELRNGVRGLAAGCIQDPARQGYRAQAPGVDARRALDTPACQAQGQYRRLIHLAHPWEILYKQTDIFSRSRIMLTHLTINNFTLVDQLDLDLKPGMTVIT